MRDGRTSKWTGHFNKYHLGKASLTSASPLHSPASVHSSSHPWNRCPVPGEVRTRKDCSLCPYDIAADRASTRRVLHSCHVSHTRARLPDQERVCPVQQVPSGYQDWGLLRRNPDAEGHRDSVKQRHSPSHHCCHTRSIERIGPRQEASSRKCEGLRSGRV